MATGLRYRYPVCLSIAALSPTFTIRRRCAGWSWRIGLPLIRIYHDFSGAYTKCLMKLLFLNFQLKGWAIRFRLRKSKCTNAAVCLIADRGQILQSLGDLLKKTSSVTAVIEWTPKVASTFSDTKMALTETTLLAHPQFDAPVRLMAHASSRAVGAKPEQCVQGHW